MIESEKIEQLEIQIRMLRKELVSSDRIEQLEMNVRNLRDNILDYICRSVEKDPDPRMTEMRLRALEDQVKALEEKQDPEKYNADR